MMVKFLIIKVNQPNCFIGKDLEVFDYVKGICHQLKNSNSKILPCSEVVIQKIYLADLQNEVVRIRVLQSINSNTFRCFLIDYGTIEEIRKQKIYNIPLNQLDMNPAVKMIKIPGIRPSGMHDVVHGPHITVHLSESDKWMPSTYKFVSRVFEENSIVHVNYLKQVSKDKMFADVLVSYSNRRENLKDLLVAQGYAFISTENEIEFLENNFEPVNMEGNRNEIVEGNMKQVENDSESIDSLENKSISIIIEGMKSDESTLIQSDSLNTTYSINNLQINNNASINRSMNGTLDELDLQVLNLKVKCWCVSKSKNEEIIEFTYTNPNRPILSFKNEKLIAKFLKDAVIAYDIKSLLLIQAYTIPSILRGFNIVAIAPHRKGKSIGLLLPILQAIATKQLLPTRSYNPLAILLCSSWKKVKDLANAAEKFIKFITETNKIRKPRIVAAYNGSTKKMTMIPILQGCDILIITPNCLLGWLKQHEFFKLNELEMFCLDDAENIIAEHLETLKEILIYKRTGAIDRGCEPGQFITATNWTSGLESFVKHEMGDRFSVAVNDTIEIAVIERMKQKIIEYDDIEGDLYQKIVAYLELTESSIKRTIIFANDDSEIASVYKYLMQKASVDLKLMTGSMSPEELNLMVKEWNQYRGYVNMPILLISDEALHCSDISIFNAQVIIHVDISESSFGTRLDFLRDKYKELTFLKSKNAHLQDQSESEKCSSFIFICSKTINLTTADFLYKFLGRCGSDRPKWLQEKAVDFRLNKEKAKGYNDICPRIKSYGECKLPGCNQRHMIMTDVDKPLLPNKGYIQFRLLYLDSPSHFYVRISEFKNISDVDFPYKSQYLSLKMKMSNYFNNPSNIHGVNLRLVQIGLIAAIKTKDLIERVIITKMKSNKSGHVLVKLIDVGYEIIVEQADLLNLPRELIEIPHQAIECYLTNIKPLDNDEFYSEESCIFANEFLENEDLHALIRLCIGSTLWIDAVTQRIHHTRTNLTVFDKNLSVILLDKNLVEKNSKHIDKLVRLCTGKIDIWKPNSNSNEIKSVPIMRKFTYTNIKPIVFEKLPIINDEEQIDTECILSCIISPNFLFFNNKETIRSLRNIQSQIESLIDSIETLSFKDINIGTRVLFFREEHWHRGYVIKVDVDIKIFSLDEGIIENFKYGSNELKKLPCEYQDLPYQAILCNLFNCSHSDISYSDDVVAAIKQYTTDTHKKSSLIISAYKEENIDSQIFVDDCETISQLKDLDLIQSVKKYSVTVSNISMKVSDRMLHNVLIRNQHILPSLLWIHEVLPESQPYASRLLRNGSIPHLAADILSTKDSVKRLRIFQTIERIIDKKYEKYKSVGFIEDNISSILNALAIIIHFVNNHLEFMCIYRSLNKLLSLAYENSSSFTEEETNNNKKFDVNYVTDLLLSYESFLFHALRHLEISARTSQTKECQIMIQNLRMLLVHPFTVGVLFKETSWYAVMAICIASLQSDSELYVLLMDILVELVMLYGVKKEVVLGDILNQCCLALKQSNSPVIWNSSLTLINCFVNKQNYSSILREIKFFEILFDKFVSYYEITNQWSEFHENALEALTDMWRNGSANFREILQRRTLSVNIEHISKKCSSKTTLCRFVADIIREESSNLSVNLKKTSVTTNYHNAPDPDALDWIEGKEISAKKYRKSYKKIYCCSDTESSSEERTNSETDSDSSDASGTPFLNDDINPADEDNVLCFEKP